MIDVAHQQQVRAGRNRLEQMVGQQQVEHGGFVHDDRIHVERVLLVALKAEAVARAELQQSVDGLGLPAGGFAQAFGRAAGGRGQHVASLGSLEQMDQRELAGCLARTRAAGDDSNSSCQRRAHRVLLFGCQRQAGLSLHGHECLRPVEAMKCEEPVLRSIHQPSQLAGDVDLGAVERHQIDSGLGKPLL